MDVPNTPLSTASSSVSCPPTCYSTRVRIAPSHLRDYHCYFALFTLHEPHNFREASSNSNWQKAMKDELNTLDKTHTWDMVDLSYEKMIVECKWVYKIKTQADSTVERYKARLVAYGFTQEYMSDYEETFAPIACFTSARTLIVAAAIRGWVLF